MTAVPATHHPNPVWAAVIAETLVRHGVRRVVVSPGSRSTPLALAVHAHPGLAVTVHADERSAAFFALGLALAAGDPVALVCTSGTAAANYLPAVVEASLARVPLVVLTADRPPALRGLGAPQTIDQTHLYGHAVRRFQELPLPEERPGVLRALAAQVALAVASAVAAPAGPVHLNVPFDEPLAPGPGEVEAAREVAAGYAVPRVWPATPVASEGAIAAITPLLAAARRPLVVAGPGARDAGGAALLALAAALDAPVIADIGSNLRGLAPPDGRVTVLGHAEAFVRRPDWGSPAPDLVIRVGGAPTGRGVMGFLAANAAVPVLALQPDLMGRDADVTADHVLVGDVAETARRLVPLARPAEAGWTERWREADGLVARAIAEGTDLPDEARAVLAAAAALPPGGVLCLSNSLPVRHADTYWGVAAARGRHALTFRGANGIDGVTSMALGVALGTGAPTLLVTGDLACLHDLGGLVAARELASPVAIVVLNNDGGGIFSQLPIATATPAFESLFGTPHGRDFAHAAAFFGLPYTRCGASEDAGEAVRAALERPGVSLIEVTTTRAGTAEAQRAFIARITAAPAVVAGGTP